MNIIGWWLNKKCLHTKPTDKHQYLLKPSCHPNHTKRTIPFSLALRLRRICSTDNFFDQHYKELIAYLVKRSYNQSFLTKEINRVRCIPRHETLKPRQQNSNANRVPFVLPSIPLFLTLLLLYGNIWAFSNLQTTANKHSPLHQSSRTKEVPVCVIHWFAPGCVNLMNLGLGTSAGIGE